MITIIVLLILAVVAITSISNSNIIKHAQNGRDTYDLAKKNEQGTLNEYEQYLDSNAPSKGTPGSNIKAEWFYFKDANSIIYLGSATEITIRKDIPIKVYTQSGEIEEDDANKTIKLVAGETETIKLEDSNITQITLEDDEGWTTNVYNADGTLIRTIPHSCSVTKITIGEGILETYKNSNYIPRNVQEIIVLDGETTICQEVFNDFKKLERVTLPNTITSIKKEAFSGCTNISTITLPASVTTMEDGVFKGWSDQQTIDISQCKDRTGWSTSWNDGCSANIKEE